MERRGLEQKPPKTLKHEAETRATKVWRGGESSKFAENA